jgi:hypothetical protein
MKPDAPANPGHESTDASPRLVGLLAAALALGIGTVFLVSYGIFAAGRGARPLAPGLGRAAAFQNGPDERTGTEQAWREIEAETRRHLGTYGWIDRPAGVVRIPIERAMDILAPPPP